MILSYLVVSRRNLRNNMGFIFLKKRTCSEFRQPYKSYLKPQYYNCKRDLVTMGVYSRCKCVYLPQEEKGYHNVRIIQMYVKKNIVLKKENFEQNRQITYTMAIYFPWNALYLSLQRGNVSSLFSISHLSLFSNLLLMTQIPKVPKRYKWIRFGMCVNSFKITRI